jgi:hypothetical protein
VELVDTKRQAPNRVLMEFGFVKELEFSPVTVLTSGHCSEAIVSV